MSIVDKQVIHDFVDGTIVVEQMLDLNFELLRNANNDNFQRLIKNLAIQSQNGSQKATQALASVMNTLTFKEGHGVTMTLENGNVLKIAIVDSGVTTASIADKNVTTSKINDAAVTNDKIADRSVTNAKLANSSVTNDKMTDNAIGTTNIMPNAITTTLISNGAVAKRHIQTGAVSLNEMNLNDVDTRYANKDYTNNLLTAKPNYNEVYLRQDLYTKGQINGIMSIGDTINVDGGNFTDRPSFSTSTIDGGTF